MPKKVDHRERREQIAAALMTVVADQGLAAVSLRHVAAEAGVTSGMVQHYFPTKDAMMDFAMETASARYETRMTRAVEELGPDPTPRELVGAVLLALLPLRESERADGRVALAFLSYAATKRAAVGDFDDTNARFRSFIAEQIRSARAASTGAGVAGTDPEHTAAALFALADGLGVHMLSTGLAEEAAVAALNAQLDLAFGAAA